jgi:hypothetical protein
MVNLCLIVFLNDYSCLYCVNYFLYYGGVLIFVDIVDRLIKNHFHCMLNH